MAGMGSGGGMQLLGNVLQMKQAQEKEKNDQANFEKRQQQILDLEEKREKNRMSMEFTKHEHMLNRQEEMQNALLRREEQKALLKNKEINDLTDEDVRIRAIEIATSLDELDEPDPIKRKASEASIMKDAFNDYNDMMMNPQSYENGLRGRVKLARALDEVRKNRAAQQAPAAQGGEAKVPGMTDNIKGMKLADELSEGLGGAQKINERQLREGKISPERAKEVSREIKDIDRSKKGAGRDTSIINTLDSIAGAGTRGAMSTGGFLMGLLQGAGEGSKSFKQIDKFLDRVPEEEAEDDFGVDTGRRLLKGQRAGAAITAPIHDFFSNFVGEEDEE